MKHLYILILLSLMPLNIFAANKSEQVGDFHITFYTDALDNTSEFEMFTKQSNKDAFLGISCTDMTPFPTLQIILLGEDIIATLSKNYIEVSYEIKGYKQIKPINLTASLKAIYKNKGFTNKIRFEVNTANIKNMREVKDQYKQLLNNLKQGSKISIKLHFAELEDKNYTFSLKGVRKLLLNHENLCY